MFHVLPTFFAFLCWSLVSKGVWFQHTKCLGFHRGSVGMAPANAGDTGDMRLLGQEGAPEEEMAPTLAWRTPWTEEPVTCSPWGCKEPDTAEHTSLIYILVCSSQLLPRISASKTSEFSPLG